MNLLKRLLLLRRLPEAVVLEHGVCFSACEVSRFRRGRPERVGVDVVPPGDPEAQSVVLRSDRLALGVVVVGEVMGLKQAKELQVRGVGKF